MMLNEQLPHINEHPKIPIKAKRLVAELAVLSYAEQTYGAKGTVRIFKDMHLGATRTFNLIDKIKCKVFNLPLDPALGEFTLLKETKPLIQIESI